MRKEFLGIIIAVIVVASLGAGYLAGNGIRNTLAVTSTQTATNTFTTTVTLGRPISVANIETASNPMGGSPTPLIGVNPNANRIYVTNGSSLIVIDAASYSVISKIALPASSNSGIINAGIAVDYNTGTVFVSVEGGVAEVNGTTNAVVREFPLSLGSVTYDPSTHTIYGSQLRGNGSLVGVSIRTGLVVENVSLGYLPYNIALNSKTNMVYAVGCNQAGLVCNSVSSIINGTNGTIVTTVHLNSAYYPTMTYDQSRNVVYVSGEEDLTALNGTNGRIIFQVNPDTCGPFLNMGVISSANKVLAVMQNYDYLLVYDGTSGALLTMYSASSPQAVAYNPNTNELYLVASGKLLAFPYSNAAGAVNSTLIGSGQTCLPP
jgi:YVTN family beta-propeller protein